MERGLPKKSSHAPDNDKDIIICFRFVNDFMARLIEADARQSRADEYLKSLYNLNTNLTSPSLRSLVFSEATGIMDELMHAKLITEKPSFNFTDNDCIKAAYGDNYHEMYMIRLTRFSYTAKPNYEEWMTKLNELARQVDAELAKKGTPRPGA